MNESLSYTKWFEGYSIKKLKLIPPTSVILKESFALPNQKILSEWPS
jgi:hypothetical protein